MFSLFDNLADIEFSIKGDDLDNLLPKSTEKLDVLWSFGKQKENEESKDSKVEEISIQSQKVEESIPNNADSDKKKLSYQYLKSFGEWDEKLRIFHLKKSNKFLYSVEYSPFLKLFTYALLINATIPLS